MIKLNDFYNAGFGWICKRCERELATEKDSSFGVSRLMREGETESKRPEFSTSALAKWTDATQKVLLCPRCGITETVD